MPLRFRLFFLPTLALLATLIAGCGSMPPADGGAVTLRQVQAGVWMHTSYNTFDGVLYPSNELVVR